MIQATAPKRFKPTLSPQCLATATQIQKCYVKPNGERIEVLNGISLEIFSGRVISFIGPSGSGKSTLLRVLAGIEEFDDGQLEYHCGVGETIPQIPMVFQNAALLPWRTARDNIALSLELLSCKDIHSEAEKYIELMGLSDFSNFLPKDLSSGMKARVSIGRALVAATQLVFFDEAFTELDEVTRQNINDIFCQHVENNGLSALIVSHDIPEAIYLSDEVIVLTKRPAKIAKRFVIQLSRPRDPSIRLTDEFAEILKPIRKYINEIWK